MKIILLRFLVVWIVLHIILYFVEKYRYKHSNWSWYGFKHDGMLNITHFVLSIDMIGGIIIVLGGLIYWILQPII